MKLLIIVAIAFAAVCWGLAIAADWFIGKVERTGKDGL